MKQHLWYNVHKKWGEKNLKEEPDQQVFLSRQKVFPISFLLAGNYLIALAELRMILNHLNAK